ICCCPNPVPVHIRVRTQELCKVTYPFQLLPAVLGAMRTEHKDTVFFRKCRKLDAAYVNNDVSAPEFIHIDVKAGIADAGTFLQVDDDSCFGVSQIITLV